MFISEKLAIRRNDGPNPLTYLDGITCLPPVSQVLTVEIHCLLRATPAEQQSFALR